MSASNASKAIAIDPQIEWTLTVMNEWPDKQTSTNEWSQDSRVDRRDALHNAILQYKYKFAMLALAVCFNTTCVRFTKLS